LLVKNLTKDFLGVIYPEDMYCICCGDILPKGRVHGICDECIFKISWIADSRYDQGDFSFDRVLSLATYNFYTERIIYDLKLNNKAYYAEYMGRLMAELLVSSGEEGVIVPVPMAKAKERKRGYNQAALLASFVAQFSGQICLKDALIKSKDTGSMRLARGGKRAFMLQGSIEANMDFSGKNVILVDDVITTGTTADICAKELKKAGANRVVVLTFGAVDYKGN